MSPSGVKKRRGYKRKPSLLNAASGAYDLLIAALVAGVILGSLAANTMDKSLFVGVSGNIGAGFSGLVHRANGADVFKESMFKYSRIIVLAWVLTFIEVGVFVQVFIIGFKGFGIGYMVSVFVMEFGKRGLLLSSGVFVIQNVGLVLMLIFITQPALIIAMEKILKKQGKATKKDQQPIGLLEKVIILLICLSLSLLIAFYEAYICPVVYGVLA